MLLIPVTQQMTKGEKWIWEAALVHVVNRVAKAIGALKVLVEKVFSAFSQFVLVPSGQFISEGASQTMVVIRNTYLWLAGRELQMR